MRALKAKDLGPFTKVLAKIGIKDLVKDFLETSSKNDEQNKTATGTKLISDIVTLVIDNYYKAEKELFAFLAEVNDTTPEEISDMPITEFIGLIKELFSGENFPFFSLLSPNKKNTET